MPTYDKESGVAITDVRVSNFRSLANIEVTLGDLTVLTGSNNAGKTSFLDALFAAVGVGRRTLGQDEVRVADGEAMAPKDRRVIVDVKIRPIGETGTVIDTFPVGSFWTALWGTGISIDGTDSSEFMAFRTVLAWSAVKGDYFIERKCLKEWKAFDAWIETPMYDKPLTSAQLEPIAVHYIDAKRDLEDDLRRQGSFWRRMTEDLGLSDDDVAALEEALSGVNQQIVDKSEVLKHLKENLSSLQDVVAGDGAGVDIAPVARKLRDLSKGIDVSFATAGAQSFPVSRHGMGTRSLASLLVFRAFASWRQKKATKENDKVQSLLLLEEPESHLHPQSQRSLFSNIKAIAGQRVVSTHSPYFAGQAQLEDLRLFIKKGGDTIVTRLDLAQLDKTNDKRKLQETVIETRGDILFARAVVLFEGQTEEQALPIWAQKYWGSSIHELGFSFVRVNGTDYFPFIWLAKSLQIPWYVIGDGEAKPIADLEAALKKAGANVIASCPHVCVWPEGKNFESQLVAEGYALEIEAALDAVGGKTGFIDKYIAELDGTVLGKNKGFRDYKGPQGRERAVRDAMKDQKTSLAKPLARMICELADPARRFPSQIEQLFKVIGSDHGITKQGEKAS